MLLSSSQYPSPCHCGNPHPVLGGAVVVVGEAVVIGGLGAAVVVEGGEGAAVVVGLGAAVVVEGGEGAAVVVGLGAAVVGATAHDPDDPYPTRKTQFDTNLKNQKRLQIL